MFLVYLLLIAFGLVVWIAIGVLGQ